MVVQQLTAAPSWSPPSSSFAGAHPAARAGAPGSRRILTASQRGTAPALMTPRRLGPRATSAAQKSQKCGRQKGQKGQIQ
jgi:hypothetical protein